jgi:hypothetical protein
MREDREYGHSAPRGRKEVIQAATNLYCSMCDATPCYLLSTAAVTVVQEQLTESDGANLIGALRYVENLKRLQSCLNRHLEVVHEAWQLDNHFRLTESALRALEEDGVDIKKKQDGAKIDIQNGGPPNPMYN